MWIYYPNTPPWRLIRSLCVHVCVICLIFRIYIGLKAPQKNLQLLATFRNPKCDCGEALKHPRHAELFSSSQTLGVRGGSGQHGNIWKPLLLAKWMGSGGESGARLRVGIITTPDQTTISSCLQLASVRR